MQKKLRVTALIVLILFVLLVAPIMRYRKEANLTSLPSRFIKGVYASQVELDKISSDMETICNAANDQALHFVILSPIGQGDESFPDTASWCKNTLVIKSQAKVADIELINLHSHLEKIPWLPRVILASRYLFNSNYALLRAIDPPLDSLSKWDLDCRKNRKTGIFSPGNEGGLSMPGITESAPPSLSSMFAILTVYARIDHELVKDPGESMEMVIDALKAGHFFNTIEAIAPANGFDARFFPAESPDIVQMGDSDTRFHGKLRIDLPFPFVTQVRLIRNGQTQITETSRLRRQIVWELEQPGVYRLEVRVPGNHFSSLPWIITNPFYLGTSHSLPTGPEESL